MNFYLIFYYCIFFFFNVIFFSLISIYLYKLLCSDIDLVFFLNSKEYSIYYECFIYNIFSSDFIYLKSFYLYYLNDSVIIYNNTILINTFMFLSTYLFFFQKDQFLQIYFFTKINLLSLEIKFICLQNYIIIFYGETSLIFFRINNLTYNNYYIISIYIIFPLNYNIIINKIQCFCFSKMYIFNNESIDLPVIFFVDSLIMTLNKIYLFYLLILF